MAYVWDFLDNKETRITWEYLFFESVMQAVYLLLCLFVADLFNMCMMLQILLCNMDSDTDLMSKWEYCRQFWKFVYFRPLQIIEKSYKNQINFVFCNMRHITQGSQGAVPYQLPNK